MSDINLGITIASKRLLLSLFIEFPFQSLQGCQRIKKLNVLLYKKLFLSNIILFKYNIPYIQKTVKFLSTHIFYLHDTQYSISLFIRGWIEVFESIVLYVRIYVKRRTHVKDVRVPVHA